MYDILTPELLDSIEQQDRAAQSLWLFLEQSEEFRGYWQVDGLWPEWFMDFEESVGAYRLVTPLGLDNFLTTANEWGYQPVFVKDPTSIIESYQYLQEPPPVALHSTLDHTINGFLPWQVVGFNKLIKDEALPGGYAVWTTGAGKTVMIASAILYHQTIGHPFDLALVVVKSHNKIDTQRKLLRLAGVDSIVIDGTKERRYKIYEQIQLALAAGEPVVAITNYEKIRQEPEIFKPLFKKRDLLIFWDEMASKLSNPSNQLYRAIKNSLYESFYSRPRFGWIRQWALSATPIENNPGGIWACTNILWPGFLGTKTEFESTYVAARHWLPDRTGTPRPGKPKAWHRLDRLEAQVSFITHRVSKDDPEVAKMFPEVLPMPTVIDWGPKQRVLYDKLTGKATDLIKELEDANVLAMIQIMQMVCDAPSMIKSSAENRQEFYELLNQYGDLDDLPPSLKIPKGSDVALTLLSTVDPKALTDVGHTKLEMWREIICEKHPDEKIVTHSTWAQYIFPVWEYWLQEWGVSYVIYHGTPKQKQTALDAFREDPSIRVFLSGDAGADSIDITEARVGVNYNIPWKWTTLQQREGRRDRVTSTFDYIYTYSLIMPGSVDERKLEVCERKKGYHQALYDGKATEEAISATMSKAELIYLITGVTDQT